MTVRRVGEIEVLAELRDDATRKLASLKKSAAATGRDLNKSGGIAKKAGGMFSAMGAKVGAAAAALGPAGIVAAAGAAAAGLARAGYAVVDLAASVEDSRDAFNAVFKGLSGEADAFALSFADIAGTTDRFARDQLANLQVLAKGFGLPADAALDLSKQTLTVAGDLASLRGVSNEYAANALAAALAGEREQLKQLVGPVTEAEVQLRALGQTGKSSAKDLTAAEKAQATLSIVMEKGADAMGDMAKTSSSLRTQINRVKSGFGNAADAIAPFLARLLRPAVDLFARLAQRAGDLAQRIAAGEGPVVKLSGAMGEVLTVARRLWEGFKAVAGLVGGALVGGFKAAWQIVQAVGGAVWELAKTFVPLLRSTSSGTRGLDTFRAALRTLGSIIGAVQAILVNLVQAFAKAGEVVAKALRGDFKGAADAAKSAWAELKSIPGEVAAAFEGATEATEAQTAATEDSSAALAASIGAMDGAANASGTLAGAQETLAERQKRVEEYTARMGEAIALSGAAAERAAAASAARQDRLAQEFELVRGRGVEAYTELAKPIDALPIKFKAAEEEGAGAFASIAAGAVQLGARIVGALGGLENVVGRIFGGIKTKVGGAFKSIADVAAQVLPPPGGMIAKAAGALVPVFESVGSAIGRVFGLGKSKAEQMAEAMEAAARRAREAFVSAMDAASSSAIAAFDSIRETADRTYQSVYEGAIAAGKGREEAIRLAEAAFRASYEREMALEAEKYARKHAFEAALAEIKRQFAEGEVYNAQKVARAAEQAANYARTAWTVAFAAVGHASDAANTQVRTQATQTVQTVQGAADGVQRSITTTARAAQSAVQQTGVVMVEVLKGVRTEFTSLDDYAKHVAARAKKIGDEARARQKAIADSLKDHPLFDKASGLLRTDGGGRGWDQLTDAEKNRESQNPNSQYYGRNPRQEQADAARKRFRDAQSKIERDLKSSLRFLFDRLRPGEVDASFEQVLARALKDLAHARQQGEAVDIEEIVQYAIMSFVKGPFGLSLDGVGPDEFFESMLQTEQFARGSGGLRDFGAGTPAVLHGREGVFTQRDIERMIAAAASGGGAREIVIEIDGREVARTLMPHLGAEARVRAY